MNKPELTIIILNYNTKPLLANCLESIKSCSREISLEVIVSDNASTDGSAVMVKKDFPWVILMEGPNSGFSKGNNRARPNSHGEFILFLNPDTVVKPGVFRETVNYLKEHSEVGALGCRLILPDGSLDKDARRRFPTPFIAFQKLFLGIGGKYWYQDIPENKVQEVEAIQGAFFLSRKKILDKVGWFDEDYFFNGEDLDLCWKIHKIGYKIIYYPKVFIYHLKGATTGKSKFWKPKITPSHKMRIKMETVRSLELFYRKNLWKNYPILVNWLVILGINVFRFFRWFKYKFLS